MDESMIEEPVVPELEMPQAGPQQFSSGFAGSVVAQQDLVMSEAGSFVAVAGNDLSLTNGGGQIMVVGNDLDINNGGAVVMVVGAGADISNGGAVAMVSKETTINNGAVGLLLTGQANLNEGTRVIFNTPQAAALGAAFGALFALVSWLLRRR